MHLIRLRYLVAAILNAAAPAGVAADDAHLLAANAREASWVLLLERLLLSLSTALALRAGRGGEPPDEEQVDLLALLQSAAILCLGTAQRERMASNVTAPLVRVVAGLEQSIRLLLAGDPGMLAHMERSVSLCDRKFARLAGNVAAPRDLAASGWIHGPGRRRDDRAGCPGIRPGEVGLRLRKWPWRTCGNGDRTLVGGVGTGLDSAIPAGAVGGPGRAPASRSMPWGHQGAARSHRSTDMTPPEMRRLKALKDENARLN